MDEQLAAAPQVHASAALWRAAVRDCRRGTPRRLLELLLCPTKLGRADAALEMHALPADPALRAEVIEALMHIGRFGARLTLREMFVRENIGTARERVHETEVAAAAALASVSGKKAVASMAAAVGVEPETMARRIRDRRKRR